MLKGSAHIARLSVIRIVQNSLRSNDNLKSLPKSNPASTPWEVETFGSRGLLDWVMYSGDFEGPGTATVAEKAGLEP